MTGASFDPGGMTRRGGRAARPGGPSANWRSRVASFLTLPRAIALVVLLVAAWTAPLAAVPATYGAKTTADEPQYLMSAISLGEDRSLDVRDERAAGRYRDFHRVALPMQEATADDGRRVSPHDPLLPALLAVPVLIGGWVGAKVALALLAGVLAGLMLWVAVRRFGVPQGVAVLAVLTYSLAAPLAMYGTQIYPELPAALAVMVAVAALTGPLRRGGLIMFGVALVALPWLSVKYAPVVVVLGALALWQLARNGRTGPAFALAGGFALAGIAYLVAHQAWYGGWTVYAAGSHFVGGEAAVMGSSPNYAGRAVRLAGLLVDRGFGLVVWQPAFLLVVPAFAALLHRRPPGWQVLAAAFAAGWLNATFVALTMQGWWWPGRQVVVVIPLAVIAVAWWAAVWAPARVALVAGLFLGAFTYLWVLVEGLAGRLTLVVDFETTTAPVVRVLRPLLPDLRLRPSGTTLLFVLWIVVLAALAFGGWRSVSPAARERRAASLVVPGANERGRSWVSPFA
jgi:hypothetical protein